MGLFTGTDATHHGFPYETFWDRQYNHLIELDETPSYHVKFRRIETLVVPVPSFRRPKLLV